MAMFRRRLSILVSIFVAVLLAGMGQSSPTTSNSQHGGQELKNSQQHEYYGRKYASGGHIIAFEWAEGEGDLLTIDVDII
jgi:hypothetical protein